MCLESKDSTVLQVCTKFSCYVVSKKDAAVQNFIFFARTLCAKNLEFEVVEGSARISLCQKSYSKAFSTASGSSGKCKSGKGSQSQPAGRTQQTAGQLLSR